MFGAQKVTLTKSGKLRRTGSPTPSQASTRAGTDISSIAGSVDSRPPPPVTNVRWEALKCYLGGCGWPLAHYESIFGKVDPQSPFGEYIWDGLLTYFGPGYVEHWGTKYHWCGDRQQYLPWLGAYNMPMKFSKNVSKSPIVDENSRPSSALYPAVFLLTPMQDNYLKSIIGDGHDPSVIFGDGVLIDDESTNDDGMSVSESEETGVDCRTVDSADVGDIYMVCLKIMISGSKPWTVNMDHVHLYSPFPPSRL